MLKKRIIAILIVKDGIVVQSIGFNRYLPIGKPEIAAEFLNMWGIDEIILIDIDAAKKGHDINMIKRVSRKCFVPLTYGGGIKNIKEIGEVIKNGADKVSINASLVKNPSIVTDGSNAFGDQCIVASIDYRRSKEGMIAYINGGNDKVGDAIELAKKAQTLGAGEILLNSIDNDGSKQGYDTDGIKLAALSVTIPLIACGGAGKAIHFGQAIKAGASAACAGNYFYFTEHSAITVKAFLKSKQELVRLDTYATYSGFSFNNLGRVTKLSDEHLDKIRFEYFPEEVI